MNPKCILIHYHEIGLKGDNRSWFEKTFVNNIFLTFNKDYPCGEISTKKLNL